MPQVSVVIPTYNRARYVTEAIDSVLAQTFTDYEIIVIDDGSTDNTREIIQPFFSKITYIYQENKGVSAARNAGIRAATGEWIAFLDSDDIWLPKKLEIQFGDISRYDNIDLHVCNGEYVNGGTTQDFFLLRGLDTKGWSVKLITMPFDHLLRFKYASLPSVVLKIKPIYFDEKIHNSEDFLYMAIIALHSKRWLLRSDKLVQFIRRPENASISLTQRHKKDFRHSVHVSEAVSNNLENYITQNKLSNNYLNSTKKFRSDRYFTFAKRSSNTKESINYLVMGLTANLSFKNFIKFITFFCKKLAIKLLINNDNQKN